MAKSLQLVSPKQVARAIGVSESSLKRWCDQGLIKTVRTAGGHRKMDIAEVVRYVREQNHELVSPEFVLRDCGFYATSLGTSIPFSSLVKAVQETKPMLFWLSVSHIREGLDFVTEFANLSHACTATDTALVVGGRALTEELRQRMTYSAYCDTMQHLEAFATTLFRSLTGGRKAKINVKPPMPTGALRK